MIALDVTPLRPRRTNQDRLRGAKRRREALVALLCAWEYEAHVAECLTIGSDPDPIPGPGYGRCAKCRCYRSFDLLEVDHADGCSWDKRKVNAWTRAARYWRELDERIEASNDNELWVGLCADCVDVLREALAKGEPS